MQEWLLSNENRLSGGFWIFEELEPETHPHPFSFNSSREPSSERELDSLERASGVAAREAETRSESSHSSHPARRYTSVLNRALKMILVKATPGNEPTPSVLSQKPRESNTPRGPRITGTSMR